ncbi:hypothetical protein AVEN_181385-1, partial [Araneus ventricosus]
LFLATFYNIFDTVPERQLVTLTTFTSFLIEALLFIVQYGQSKRLSVMLTPHMSYMKRHYGDEVTVVFVGYTESRVNTKVIERQRRRMKRTSREIIFNESTVLLEPQRQSSAIVQHQ